MLRRCAAAAYQVLVGEPRDLVLQTGFDSGLRRQLKVLGQELLLTVVVLLHALQLAAQRLHLHVGRPLLGLQLVLQQPGGEQAEEQMKKGEGPHGVWELKNDRKDEREEEERNTAVGASVEASTKGKQQGGAAQSHVGGSGLEHRHRLVPEPGGCGRSTRLQLQSA